MATLVAWNLASQQIRAEEDGSASASCHLAQIEPAGSYQETEFVTIAGYTGKAQICCAPANGRATRVQLEVRASGWKDGETTMTDGDWLVIVGEIDSSQCPNCFRVSGAAKGDRSNAVLYLHTHNGPQWIFVTTQVELYVQILDVITDPLDPNMVTYEFEVRINYTKIEENALTGTTTTLESLTDHLPPFSRVIRRVDL